MRASAVRRAVLARPSAWVDGYTIAPEAAMQGEGRKDKGPPKESCRPLEGTGGDAVGRASVAPGRADGQAIALEKL